MCKDTEVCSDMNNRGNGYNFNFSMQLHQFVYEVVTSSRKTTTYDTHYICSCGTEKSKEINY